MAVAKVGFFTRWHERAAAGDRCLFAFDQARHAEQLGVSTAWVAQHSIDPGRDATMRSLELIAREVATALGWTLSRGTTETGRNTPALVGRARETVVEIST
jgi:hypothetical protein